MAVQRFQYKTEVLTSLIGRDKMRMEALDDCVNRNGWEGWELVSMNPSANIRGMRDGHLLVFKRAFWTDA